MVRKITDKLFIGSKLDAEINNNNFDIIVSMEELPDYPSEEFIIDDGEHEYRIFNNAVNFVIKCLREDKSILIHCQEGISRSVSVCAAAYSVHYDTSFKKSCKLCFHKKYKPTVELEKSAKRYVSETNNRL